MEQNMETASPSNEIKANPTPTILGSAPQTPTTPESPKNSNPLGIILAIILILALVIAGICAFLFLNNPTAPGDGQSSNSNSSSAGITDSEEVVITDRNILEELNEKISILHGSGVSSDSNPIIIESNIPRNLYADGTLDDNGKLQYLLEYLKQNNYYRPLTEEERAHMATLTGFDIDRVLDFGINGELVAKKYLDTFGEELEHRDTNLACIGYSYDQTYDLYFKIDSWCGGYSPVKGYYYKNKYTADNNYAYVYVSVAAVDMSVEPAIIYCTIPVIFGDDNSDSCGTISNVDDFTIDETNYQKFDQYRFVFKKTDDGTYYFKEVEKL